MASACVYGRVHQWRRASGRWRCRVCGATLCQEPRIGAPRRVACPYPGHRERAYAVESRPSTFLGRDFIRVDGRPYSDFQVEFWRCGECGRAAPHPERGHFQTEAELPLAM